MKNVLEVFVDQDFLFELADELDVILSCIAYAGEAENFEYIKGSIEHLKEKYGEKVEGCREKGDCRCWASESVTPMDYAVDNIFAAYDFFQGLLSYCEAENKESWNKETPKQIQERAEEILMEHVLVPEETVVVYDKFGFDLKYP
ncbi:MAG: hypothetical protein ACE5J4_02080 [Candidatus Aenigmatarchaeota archaeon]